MTTSHLGWLVLHGEFYCVNGSVVDVHELASVVMAVNDIWDQAHIRFSMGVGETIDPVPHWPSPYSADQHRVRNMVAGRFSSPYSGVRQIIWIPGPLERSLPCHRPWSLDIRS